MINILSKKILFWGAGLRMARILPYLEKTEFQDFVIFDSSPENAFATVCDKYEVFPNSDFGEYLTGMPLICITVYKESVKKSIIEMLKKDYRLDDSNFIEYDDIMAFLQEEIASSIKTQASPKADSADVLIMNIGGLCLGGVETWIRDLYWGLKEAGNYKPKCLLGRSIKSEEKDSEIDCYCTDHIDVNTECDSFIKAIEFMEECAPKNIVLTHPDVFLDAAIIMKKRCPNDIRLFFTIHGGRIDQYKRVLDNITLFDRIICCSKLWTNVIKENGAHSELVEGMECPFECPEILDRSYSGEGDLLRIGWAGRVVKGYEKDEKRLDLLLQVAKKLKDRDIPYNISIAGDGDGLAKFRDEIDDLGLRDSIEIHGRLKKEAMIPFWKMQDVCLLTSDSEGRCISMLEAMGCGAVPVVTDVSGVREEIVDNENGYFVPVGDVEALTDRIEYLYRNRELLPVFGKRSHDTVYPKSSVGRHVDFWEKIFNETK